MCKRHALAIVCARALLLSVTNTQPLTQSIKQSRRRISSKVFDLITRAAPQRPANGCKWADNDQANRLANENDRRNISKRDDDDSRRKSSKLREGPSA